MNANLRLPDFMIIGGMRCGSTALWKLMQYHPAVFFPETKEIHYFDNRRDSYSRGIDYYGRFFCKANPEMVVGEATPNYLYLDEARKRILHDIPSIKLIVILRNPVQRAWSHYWFRVRQGLESKSFQRAIELECERIAKIDDWSRFRFAYQTLGHYATFLRSWMDHTEGNVHVVFLEDLVRSPGAVMQEVLSHIGLNIADIKGEIDLPHMNRAVYFRSVPLQGFARKCEGFKPESMGHADRIVRRFGRMLLRLNTITQKQDMPAQVRRKLIDAYMDSNAKLEKILGRSVPWRMT